VAAGHQPSVLAAMSAMSRAGSVIEPAGAAEAAYHAHKYRVFLSMHEHQLAYRAGMAS
jgi:ribulose kinase